MSSPTAICEFKDGWYKRYTISPEDFGFKLCQKNDLRGGDPAENAKITRDILAGVETGAKLDAVLLNAGAALYIAGKSETMADGINLAKSLIDSSAATSTLEKFIEVSNR